MIIGTLDLLVIYGSAVRNTIVIFFGWTKNRGPFELIYYEASKNETDARSREKYLKSGMGKRYIKNRLKRFLSLTG